MKTVPLTRSYTVGSATFSSLTFRPPRLADYRQFGPVVERQNGMVATYRDAVWSYAEQLLQEVPPGALGELDLADAIGVEDFILGFFTDAMKAWRKHASSSSGSAGAPPTSSP